MGVAISRILPSFVSDPVLRWQHPAVQDRWRKLALRPQNVPLVRHTGICFCLLVVYLTKVPLILAIALFSLGFLWVSNIVSALALAHIAHRVPLFPHYSP